MKLLFKIFLLLPFLASMQCSKPFPDDPFLVLLNSLNQSSSEDLKKYFFVTSGTYTGNLGGVSGADCICDSEKNANFASLVGSGTDYKALIVDAALTRVACTSIDCSGGNSEHTDWVLQSNTEYYLPNGDLALTTNANAIVKFSAPENQSLTTEFNSTSNHWWTGLDHEWRFLLTCTGGIWSNTAGFGNIGLGNQTDNTAIGLNTNTDTCGTFNHLLCVRQ